MPDTTNTNQHQTTQATKTNTNTARTTKRLGITTLKFFSKVMCFPLKIYFSFLEKWETTQGESELPAIKIRPIGTHVKKTPKHSSSRK